ncbi:MAG: hypothetical protein ACR65U_05090 [Methylocystis sp.]
MKFTLTYDGELPSTGNGSRKTERKWEIRKHFHPQLQELWTVHPALRKFSGPHYVGSQFVEGLAETNERAIDVCAPIQKAGRLFKPIVRRSLGLTCSLNVLFLRKESAGRVYQGGDLDNRIKTLLDALSVPAHIEQVIDDGAIDDPVLCLLEDDALVTGLSVQTERLLTRPGASESEVRLTIEVDIRVSDARRFNSEFLGE